MGLTETSLCECVPPGLMYFSSLCYILMINFMLFHGIFSSWIIGITSKEK